ncbi:LysM peptidoglycan-binding domain-containing protein [Heliophilum fasciatum]|uniref:LysM domain-containing protein n=1 Tax=Heliophilum fasciatum TaxID=35700 RepID=A0A4V2SX61_9FIRM|nr:LysM peptidoglycan-binding domain-containing protein [Heliophilum fasciatum]MCW2277709.1 LysM repeat protein [Heliophilum fasciatum]TCP65056.1 LysM domain-containing protein [Heliophilum fasciatum]
MDFPYYEMEYQFAQLPTPFGTLTYVVEPGDSLLSIARKFNTTINNILLFNRISNPNLIYVGQSVIVPLSPPESIIYIVQMGDTLYSIAKRFGTRVDTLIAINYLTRPQLIYPGQQLVVNPSLRG